MSEKVLNMGIITKDLGNSKTYARDKNGMWSEPSAIREIPENPFKSDKQVSEIVRNLSANLVVRIDSPVVPEKLYEVGEIAINNEDHEVRRIKNEKKYESHLPIVVSLAMIGGRATEILYEQQGEDICGKTFKVKLDMVTGLPTTEWTSAVAEAFEAKFKDHKHEVKVYLGLNKWVKIEINFDFVKALPEATPVVYSLFSDVNGKVRSGKIFEEFLEEYGDELPEDFNGQWFGNKRILHIDIGEGTTEFPFTNGFDADFKFVDGLDVGIGEAIQNMLKTFSEEKKMRTVKRTNISAFLENEDHKYHSASLNLVKQEIYRTKSNLTIADEADRIMDDLKNEIDVVVVYGGGSILMKDALYEDLKEICDDREIKLLYIPAKFATTLFLDGLYCWANVNLEEEKAKSKKQKAVQEKQAKLAEAEEEVAVGEEDEE